MSAFYDLASLVLVPSGYKASKVYAQKPLTTDGQLTFSRASTATRVNSAGLIETVSSNVPRLDYTNSTCPRLLLEPQRQNVCLWSEQLQNWSSTNTTVTTNVFVSPDGTQNADTITLLDNTSRVFQALSLGAGTYTASVYAKYVSGSGPVRFNLVVDGANLSFEFTPTAQFTRFTYTFTATTGVTSYQLRGLTGTTGTVSFWGAMLEAGSYATSYVKTEAAAVTRLADAASKTGISSLIGQTEGVLFVDFVPNNTPASGVQQWLFFLGSGSAYIAIFISSGQKLRANIANTTDQAVIDTSFNLVAGTRYKAALAYKENDFAFYVNGVQIGIDTSGTVPAISSLQNNYNTTAANSSNAGLNQALLFKTRLTNAQLAELTTL